MLRQADLRRPGQSSGKRQSGDLRRSTHTANGHLALQFSEGQNQVIALFLNAQGFHVAE